MDGNTQREANHKSRKKSLEKAAAYVFLGDLRGRNRQKMDREGLSKIWNYTHVIS